MSPSHVLFVWMLLILDLGTIWTTSPRTTTPKTTFKTTVPLPSDACWENGKIYRNGENITVDSDGCGGTMCMEGSVIDWDAPCMFHSPSPPTTTPPPTTIRPRTTTPHGPAEGCFIDGRLFRDGQNITVDSGGCGGTMCICGGTKCGVAYWDAWCMFYSSTPSTTTPPSTTTRGPPGWCYYNNKWHHNYDIFDLDALGCHGQECHYGNVRPWHKHCLTTEWNCNGTLRYESGKCCPVCEDVVQERTTLPPLTTQSSSTQTTRGCSVRGQIYPIDARTNMDVCNKCYCTVNGEVCQRTVCEEVSDCAFTYRPKGECCFMCGNAEKAGQSFVVILLPLTVTVALIWKANL